MSSTSKLLLFSEVDQSFTGNSSSCIAHLIWNYLKTNSLQYAFHLAVSPLL